MANVSSSPTAVIAHDAVLGDGVVVGHFSVIHSDVILGDGVSVGIGAIIYPGVRVCRNAVIQDYAVVGKQPRRSKIATWGPQEVGPTQIGEGATIGANAIVFQGCRLGSHCFIGDAAFVREGCVIGEESVVGNNARLEFGVRVGRKSLVFSAAFLAEHTLVEDQVFIGAMVSTAAGKAINFQRLFPGEIASPVFRRGARVGTGAVIHPRVVVGREAVVAAGAVVFESVPDAVVVLGNPARPVRRVSPEEFLPDSDLLSQPPPDGRES